MKRWFLRQARRLIRWAAQRVGLVEVPLTFPFESLVRVDGEWYRFRCMIQVRSPYRVLVEAAEAVRESETVS